MFWFARSAEEVRQVSETVVRLRSFRCHFVQTTASQVSEPTVPVLQT